MEIANFSSQADREKDAQRRSKVDAATELSCGGIAEQVGVLHPVVQKRAALVQPISKASREPRRDALSSKEFQSQRRSDVQRSQATDAACSRCCDPVTGGGREGNFCRERSFAAGQVPGIRS